jgi:protein tyrosine phosphatase (PTP) superfamily phosphohydrolase (DUF442 family)
MLDLRMKPKRKPPTEPRQWVDPERCWSLWPSDRQLREFAEGGVLTALHLTEDGKPSDAERKRVEAAGLNYMYAGASRNRIHDDEVRTIFALLERRQDAPIMVYDQDGAMAGVMTLLFKAVPNFWTFDRYVQEAARRGINVDVSPAMRGSIESYLRRFVRGRR